MKTIFITIFQGVEAKNILRTPVLPVLLRVPDLRLVFLVRTQARAEHYRREFRDPRIIYEVADALPRGPAERFFSWLKFHLIRTATTDLRRRMELDAGGSELAYWAGLGLNRLIARPLMRRIARWVDRYAVADPGFGPLFRRYRPDLVFLAHLFDDAEVSLLREAKRRGVAAVGFINSWDKLTARSALRLLPDGLLVYSDLVRAEALAHADMPEDRIRVVGIPQYDHYVGHHPPPRGEFLARYRIDPSRRLLLYAPMGETFSAADWQVIDLLQRWCQDGTLPPDVALLVRFQPNDAVDEVELRSRPWLRYDRPGIRFSQRRGVDWDMSAVELRQLADTLAHADLLVSYATSLSVDAAVFGKPVINIGFELAPAPTMMRSPTHFYRMAHYQNALSSGGIRLVRSPAELADWIRRYLADPELDRAGRERLVREQCGPLDGQAGERIAEAVIRALP